MLINNQPKEKVLRDPKNLHLHSVFFTLQGEGPLIGHPAVFIRMAGCNLQCPMCDTEYTERQPVTPEQIVRLVEKAPPRGQSWSNFGRLAVITGGEPLRQDISDLTVQLLEAGYKVQLETNGTLGLPEMPWPEVTTVCSPKTPRLHPKIIPFITAYKYVLDAEYVSTSDGLPTWGMGLNEGEQLARPPWDFSGPVYIQPLDSKDKTKNKANLEACVKSCMKFGYMMGIQLHKYLGLD